MLREQRVRKRIKKRTWRTQRGFDSDGFGYYSLIGNKLVCRDRGRRRRRRRCSWGTRKGGSSADRSRSRNCRDFGKYGILTQTRDALKLPREIRDQGITLLAGRVLEQSPNVLPKLVSL